MFQLDIPDHNKVTEFIYTTGIYGAFTYRIYSTFASLFKALSAENVV